MTVSHLRQTEEKGESPGGTHHGLGAARGPRAVGERVADGAVAVQGGGRQHVRAQVNPERLAELDRLAQEVAAVEPKCHLRSNKRSRKS